MPSFQRLFVLCIFVLGLTHNALAEIIPPGITQFQFQKHFPKAELSTPTMEWLRKANEQGLPGQWSYHFEQGILRSYAFHAHSRELTPKRFAQWRSGAVALIAQLTRELGPPTTRTDGDQHFRDPAKKQHWGYDVIDAYWNRIKYGVRVKFTFFGGKGDYFFVTSLEVEETEEWKQELDTIRSAVTSHIATNNTIGAVRVGYIQEHDNYALATVHARETVTDPASVWLRRSKSGDWVVIAGPTTALDSSQAAKLGIPARLR